MTQNIPVAIRISEQTKLLVQIIFKQQYTIQELQKDILTIPSQYSTIGWHNDPDWEEYHMHKKNNATAKARAVMLRMRQRYGFE